MRLGALWFVAPFVALACTTANNYVYTARRYDGEAACLHPYRSVDLVKGDKVSTKCAPACFRYGDDLFTSTMCPPLPDLATALDAASPECVAANALYGTTCGGDAGPDAGDDDDASTDVLDAGGDGG